MPRINGELDLHLQEDLPAFRLDPQLHPQRRRRTAERETLLARLGAPRFLPCGRLIGAAGRPAGPDGRSDRLSRRGVVRLFHRFRFRELRLLRPALGWEQNPEAAMIHRKPVDDPVLLSPRQPTLQAIGQKANQPQLVLIKVLSVHGTRPPFVILGARRVRWPARPLS